MNRYSGDFPEMLIMGQERDESILVMFQITEAFETYLYFQWF